MYSVSGGVREYIMIPEERQRYDFFNPISYWSFYNISTF
jgi:hypothetical protein